MGHKPHPPQVRRIDARDDDLAVGPIEELAKGAFLFGANQASRLKMDSALRFADRAGDGVVVAHSARPVPPSNIETAKVRDSHRHGPAPGEILFPSAEQRSDGSIPGGAKWRCKPGPGHIR